MCVCVRICVKGMGGARVRFDGAAVTPGSYDGLGKIICTYMVNVLTIESIRLVALDNIFIYK